MWFVFAFTFALCSSFSIIVAKHVIKRMKEYTFLMFSGIFSAPILLGIVLYFHQIPKVDGVFFLSLLVSTAIGIVAALLAYRAIKISDLSLVSPMSAFNPVFTAVISFFTLGETIDQRGILGIGLIVVGAYLLQVSKSKKGVLEPIRALATHKGVQFSLIAYFIWAITPTFEKTAIRHTIPRVPPFASLVSMLMSTVVYAVLASRGSEDIIKKGKQNFKFFVLIGLLGGVGQAAVFTAFSLASLGPVTAIFKLSMIFTVILSWLFFKEKNIKDKLLGSVIMLSGVILLVT